MASRPTPNLIDKGVIVRSLWEAFAEGKGSLRAMPGLIRRVIQTGAWQKREFKGRVYEHPTFEAFIRTQPLAGCGWNPEDVEALIKHEPEILALWREAMTRPVGAAGHDNGDNVTIKPERGNSKAYTLTRLKEQRPDLFHLVVTREMSANAAAMEAGWRSRTVSVPIDNVSKVAEILRRRLTTDDLRELSRLIGGE